MLSIDTTAFIVAPHATKVLQGADYKLVTVAECLCQQPYLSTGPPTSVHCSSPFISNNTLIDIFYILFVGHMVLLNIGLFDILHTTIPYTSSVCLLRFSMFMTKLDIFNVLNCEICAECLVVTTLRFDFWIRVQVHRLNGIHRRVTRLCIIVRSALAA